MNERAKFLHKRRILEENVAARDFIPDDLVADINDIGQAKISVEAKAYKAR